MKKLTRLLLINWHFFQNTMIDFDTINFLTGKNSAGKSTIIDALQVVLMGETRSTAFNRAAGKRSERTLKSYLVGSMGEDINSGNKSVREGKDFSTYIVAEFYDDMKSAYLCFGAIFDSFSDGGEINKRFFYLKDRIPECRFIENGKTMDSRRITQFFKENYPNKYETKDTGEAYRKIVLARLNIHDEKFVSMLKKAISFEPINDIEKFITENVCDIEDDIDIIAMQENIHYYEEQQSMARVVERQMEKLSAICSMFSEIEKLRSRRQMQQFLIDYGTYNDYLFQLKKAHNDLEQYDNDIAEFKNKYIELEKSIGVLEKAKDKLNEDIALYRANYSVDRLEEDEKRYKKDIERYEKSIEKFILTIKTLSIQWLDILKKINSECDNDEIKFAAKNAEKLFCRTEKFSESDFKLLSPDYFSKIREAYLSLKDFTEPVLNQLNNEVGELENKSSELRSQITSLKQGIKPYPKKAEKLKNAISDGLKKKYGKIIPVNFLADMVEITDEEWHDAVEGYFNTQRMNIIVPPQYFMDAYEIYKLVRVDGNIHEYAVVDLERVYECNSKAVPNNLAEVVKSDDKYVQAYINYLLGKVTRCYSDDKLRDFRTSVTRECMLYNNFSVKPLNADAYKNPYIGRNSIEKLIENKTKLLNDITKEVNVKSRKCSLIAPVISTEWLLNEGYINSTVKSAFETYQYKNETKQKLEEVMHTLGKIDFFWIDEMKKKVEDKERELQEARKGKEDTSNFINDFEREKKDTVGRIIPELENNIKLYERKIFDEYTDDFKNNSGIPRYNSELAECGSPNIIAKKFISPIKGTESQILDKENQLRDKRSEYNSSEHTAFKVADVSTNDEYENKYRQISDYELPKYKEHIEKAKNDAMEQFKSDFLYKLRLNIETVQGTIDELNDALKMAQFGNDKYRFEVKPDPAYIEYYNMIMSPLLDNGNVGLFSYEFAEKYKSVIDNLFVQIVSYGSDSVSVSKSVEEFSKYKTYLSFDLLSTDSSGRTDRLSKSISTKSGGETQTPFYIAVLASFAQLYKVNYTNEYGNTARIVIFDEAFNKMDGERIIESVRLLRKFGLQAIICSPPEKAADVAPVSDKTLLVYKEAEGGIYRSTVIEWTKEIGEV